MDIFAERLKSTFATLVRPLTPEDGESEASISVAEARLALRLPAVLREVLPSGWQIRSVQPCPQRTPPTR